MRESLHLHANSPDTFQRVFSLICHCWLQEEPFDRGEVHAQKVVDPSMVTRELRDVILDVRLPGNNITSWQSIVEPNLPWAEAHFRERVSGMPLNPPPEEANWPYAQAGNAAHKKGEMFSHTYPERFWPRYAGDGGRIGTSKEELGEEPIFGIRYYYGDLGNVIDLLVKNPRTRQAYLPVWFPEDLNAAMGGERVPCTLGYHFMLHPDGYLHMTYHMRSCDIVRFLKDDIYMAGRLLQWVANAALLPVGGLRLTISSLHAFEGDKAWMQEKARKQKPEDKRAGYNFEALG